MRLGCRPVSRTAVTTYTVGEYCPQDCFHSRVMAKRDKLALHILGDWVTVYGPGKKHGTRLLGTWDEVEEKDDTLGTRGVRYREIIFCYLTCDYPLMNCSLRIQKEGAEYEVRGDPEYIGDGWSCVTLKKCRSC